LSKGPKSEVSQVGGDDRLKSEAHDWIVRLTSGSATIADAKALNAWCEISPSHAQAFAEAKDLWHALRNAVRTLR
jgi:transmembrane sensor